MQTVAKYDIENPAGREHGTVRMRAQVERGDGGQWIAMLTATDYHRVIGQYNTQAQAAQAAVDAARDDDPLGEISIEPFFAE